MEVIFAPKAINDIAVWRKSGNKAILNRITMLIKAIQENPFEGIGKPEPLKHKLSGLWSRRINHEHRIIYEVYNDNQIAILEIFSLRGHYKD
ncbi:Txe/YoeB family addiction module toxin (plasmid) [Pedobacter sp. BS3]|uniref:Txe/YoeB family addiction module toxin n=1 Tax=Pedobacter sp. BS3 TaxID=2567937 RepID=UPI0011EE6E14|nr:Txe/YoeB family addiction module toxin [Pedobacter sp. BS3]TZF85650.1 Txe/YoeB family addiction module toxin [Pedobacter sp. BS3]